MTLFERWMQAECRRPRPAGTRAVANANPANSAKPGKQAAPSAPQISGISGFSISTAPSSASSQPDNPRFIEAAERAIDPALLDDPGEVWLRGEVEE